jgi:hypothetical protein
MMLSLVLAPGSGNDHPADRIPSVVLSKYDENLVDRLARSLRRSPDVPSDGRAEGSPAELGACAGEVRVAEQDHADVWPVLDLDEADDQLVYDFSHGWLPDASAASRASRAAASRSRLPRYALALAEPLLLVAVGIGLAVVIRAEPTGRVGGEASVLEADRSPGVKVEVPTPAARPPADPVPGTIDLLSRPDQPVGSRSVGSVAAIDPAESRNPVTLPAPSIAVIVAEDPPPQVPPEPSAEAAISAAPDTGSTASIDPNPTTLPKSAPDAVPLPPTRPLTLVDETSRTSQQFRPGGSGGPSFTIQLAASHSASDALAILSRLKERYPEMLAGGAVRRADKGNSGIFYRVQAGPLPRDAAIRACAWLKKKGEDCIVVR